MTTEGWIFMVGFRVFDVGLLVLWLIWFFRLRDDGEEPPEEGGGGGEGGPEPGPSDGPGGGGFGVPLGRCRPGGPRVRGHGPLRPGPRRRGAEPPVPSPLPARVRRPSLPSPARHPS
ncbi:MAG: hypothetical protein ABR581_02580 [Thermoleophilaceae bacterium]